jgi:hypothetical protein
MSSLADWLLIAAVVVGLWLVVGFLAVAIRTDDARQRYVGSKNEHLRDVLLSNAPALPFLATVPAVLLTDLDDQTWYLWVLTAGVVSTFGLQLLPAVRRARAKLQTARPPQ